MTLGGLNILMGRGQGGAGLQQLGSGDHYQQKIIYFYIKQRFTTTS